jgi:hypothetical protein
LFTVTGFAVIQHKYPYHKLEYGGKCHSSQKFKTCFWTLVKVNKNYSLFMKNCHNPMSINLDLLNFTDSKLCCIDSLKNYQAFIHSLCTLSQTATGWMVWGSNTGGGARFSAPVKTGPGAHPASCATGTRSFPGVKSGWGVTLTPTPTSSAVGHERAEIYLYSPYGPYGLYRASMPVQ